MFYMYFDNNGREMYYKIINFKIVVRIEYKSSRQWQPWNAILHLWSGFGLKTEILWKKKNHFYMSNKSWKIKLG